MKVKYQSELMKNQKHAEVMAPDVAFEVLQTAQGDALFFSIGTDHILYVTREVRASQTGWTKVDLSSSLSAPNGGKPVVAKSFTLSQNPQTLAFDIALVATIAGADFLYVSLNHSNDANEWAKGVPWTRLSFDASGIRPPSPLTIADVYLMNIPSTDGSGSPATQNMFVDIMRTPGDPLKLLDRYYIQPTNTPHWGRHTLPADIAAGSVSSCLGHRPDDYVPGIYTYGTIGTTHELIFTPQVNAFRPDVAPNSARLTLPQGATAISSALNAAGDTNLFVAATDGLHLFTPDNQFDGASPTLIVQPKLKDKNLFAGASSISASTVGSRTVVWAINAQGNLFYVSCPAGSEANIPSWTAPIPILAHVENFAFYLNNKASNNVLFAHTSGQQLIQLTQDHLTGHWTQRSILLPATKMSDMLEYNSFTSHITITSDNGTPQSNIPTFLTSTSPVTVYINDVYHVLTPTVPINISSDCNGTITVIQETQALTAVSFKVTIPGPPTIVASVDPLSKAIGILASIKSKDDIGKAEKKTTSGVNKKLLPSDVLSDDKTKAAVASSITQLIQVKGTLPQDGSRKTATSSTAAVSRLASTAAHANPLPAWGMSFGPGGLAYHEGDEVQKSGLLPVDKAAVSHVAALAKPELNLVDAIDTLAGDLFQWLKHAWDSVVQFVVKEAEGVYHFIVQIGDTIYKAILDCISAITNALEFVFNKIKVFFEDLIAWLGFIFEWDDIVTTHRVVKNIFNRFAYNMVDQLDTLEHIVNDAFITMEKNINAWAGITDPGITIGTHQTQSSNITSDTPQNNWALHHSKNGLSSAETTASDPKFEENVVQGILADLEAIVVEEGDYITTTITQIKDEIADKITTLTPLEILKKVIAIASDLILKTARNLIVKFVDILKIIVKGMVDLLNAPLDIPILSSIYESVAGEKLSVMDVVCLIGSIPATVLFKIAANRAPFPKNSQTQALIDAKSLDALTKLFSNKTVHADSSASVPSAHVMAHGKVLTHSFAATQDSSPPASIFTPGYIASIVLDFVSTIGADFVIACNAFKFGKQEFSETGAPILLPLPLRIISAAAYFPFVASNFVAVCGETPGTWYNIMNLVVTGIAIGKTIADNTPGSSENTGWVTVGSPVMEAVVNAVWIVPAGGIIAGSKKNDSDWVSLGADLAFDIGGILAAGTVKGVPPPATLACFVLIEILTDIYGILCITQGSLLCAGK